MNKLYLPVVILFVLISVLIIVFKDKLQAHNLNYIPLLVANGITALLSLISLSMHISAIKNNNAKAFVRSVMLGSFMKLMVIGFSALIYLFIVKSQGKYTVLGVMVFYFIYTFVEVRMAMRLNKNL